MKRQHSTIRTTSAPSSARPDKALRSLDKASLEQVVGGNEESVSREPNTREPNT
jgi:hypothetical protein